MTRPQTPSLDDFANAEHFVLEDTTVQHEALTEDYIAGHGQTHEITNIVEIRDRLRRRTTTARFYEDGWVDFLVVHGKKPPSRWRIDLRYLDPRPIMRMYQPVRLLQLAALLGAFAGVLAIPAGLGWQPLYTLPATIVATLATLGTLSVAWYRTHEKICFRTLHGRAAAIRIGAGLGTIRKFHKLVPQLIDAIDEAARSVQVRNDVYLRAEMREHYRLRQEGILSESECVESTGRILGSFDTKR